MTNEFIIEIICFLQLKKYKYVISILIQTTKKRHL